MKITYTHKPDIKDDLSFIGLGLLTITVFALCLAGTSFVQQAKAKSLNSFTIGCENCNPNLEFDPDLNLSVFKEQEIKNVFLPDGTDLRRLSRAVAMHETKDCAIKTNFTIHNNCHGFRWNGRIYRFNTKEESHEYFIDLWKRKYGRFPDKALARKYSGNDRSDYWLRNVTYFYNNM